MNCKSEADIWLQTKHKSQLLYILQFLALAAKRVHDEMYLPKVLLFAAVSHMTIYESPDLQGHMAVV